MSANSFIAVPPPPALPQTHFASTKLGSGSIVITHSMDGSPTVLSEEVVTGEAKEGSENEL